MRHKGEASELEITCETGSEQDFADQLGQGFTEYADVNETEATYRSFREAGLLTGNAGVVITVGDAEFQVTVVRKN